MTFLNRHTLVQSSSPARLALSVPSAATLLKMLLAGALLHELWLRREDERAEAPGQPASGHAVT